MCAKYHVTTNRSGTGEQVYDSSLAIAEIIINEIIQDPEIAKVVISADDGLSWLADCDGGDVWTCTAYDEDGMELEGDELADWIYPFGKLVTATVEGHPCLVTDRWHEVGELFGEDDVAKALDRVSAMHGDADGYDPGNFTFTAAVDLREVITGDDFTDKQADICDTGQEIIWL